MTDFYREHAAESLQLAEEFLPAANEVYELEVADILDYDLWYRNNDEGR